MRVLVPVALAEMLLLCSVAAIGVERPTDAGAEWRYTEPVTVLHVKATGYNANDGHEWCGRLGCGRVVYTGGRPWVGTVAVSKRLAQRIPMGTIIRIRGWLYRVRDLMGPTVRGDQVDIYFPTVAEALSWGVRGVDVEVLDSSGNDL
jgi:3D (Asp-Asp-Asp) domain-containing protein